MTTFPFTVRATDNTLGFADRTFSIDVTNDQLERFIIVGGNGLATSKDGLTWTPQIGATLGGILIEFCGDRWVKIKGFNPAEITWSYDGTTWQTYATPTNWPSTLIAGIDLVYDAASGRTYLWGYSTDHLYLGYTTNWTSFTTIYNPTTLINPESVYFAESLAVFGSNIVTVFNNGVGLGIQASSVGQTALVSNDSGATFQVIDTGVGMPITDLKYFNNFIYGGTVNYPYPPAQSVKSADGTVWAIEESNTYLGGAGSNYYANNVLGYLNGASLWMGTTAGGAGNTRVINPATYPNTGDYSAGSITASPLWIGATGFAHAAGATGALASTRTASVNGTMVFIVCGGDVTKTGVINTVVIGADPFSTGTQTSIARPALATALGGGITPTGNTIGYQNISDVASRP